VARIAKAANHALTLVEEMLRAGRLDPRNPATVAPESALDVEDVIAEAILLQQEALDQARCAVTVTRKPGLERAQGAWNRGCLLRIFCNLLQNATKYAPAAPVRVQLARAGDRLRIVFADRGPGISALFTAPQFVFIPFPLREIARDLHEPLQLACGIHNRRDDDVGPDLFGPVPLDQLGAGIPTRDAARRVGNASRPCELSTPPLRIAPASARSPTREPVTTTSGLERRKETHAARPSLAVLTEKPSSERTSAMTSRQSSSSSTMSKWIVRT